MTSLVLDWVYFYQTFKAMETVGKISKVSGLSPIIIGWSRYAVWQGLECDTQLHSTPYNRCFEQRLCLNRKPSTAREHDDFQVLSYNSDSNFSFWYAGGNFMRSVHAFFFVFNCDKQKRMSLKVFVARFLQTSLGCYLPGHHKAESWFFFWCVPTFF